MWPQTLQMSDDDCRSTLRRLELETYANVVGVFRAQGGLSDKKVKLLEELRNIFHISQDRHRAEARRVANDEYLSTIAKVVSGPNTWQEWSREGRRSYPMLPRVAPQTALGWIANNLAAEAAIENSKLPYPAETAAAALEEQNVIKGIYDAAEASGFRYHDKFIVTSDPFKLPDIPTVGAKKNLKRSNNDSQQITHASVGKKRQLNETSSPHKQKHVTATNVTTTTISGSNRKAISNDVVLRQRFFYQQQQKAKKLAKAASKREKLPGTGKLGRKPKKLKELEQRQQREREREQQEQYLQQEFSDGGGMYENQIDHSDYALSTNIANVMIDMGNQVPMPQQQQQQQQQHQPLHDIEPHYIASGNQKSLYIPMAVPQIAASKRDITRNLTKLQIPAPLHNTSPTSQIAKQQHSETTVAPMASSHATSSSPATPKSSTLLISGKPSVDGKITPLSTPVQKYIVEDRLPQMTTATAGALPPSLLAQQTTSSQFTAGFSQTKLRPISTTVLPAGTKLTASAKKLSGSALLSPGGAAAGGASSPLLDNILASNPNSSPQIFNLTEGTNAATHQGNISQPTPPTHTPPAVIQIHNSSTTAASASAAAVVGSTTSTTQSKVLTTKILPIVLSSNSAKADAAKNGAASVVTVSTANFVASSPGSTIIKSLPASLLVSGQHINASSSSSVSSPGTVFSNFGSPTGTSTYRKQPNILRSSSTTAARQLQNSTATKTGGPQIISNIRLTPANSSTGSLSSSFSGVSTSSLSSSPLSVSSTQPSSIFQQQLRSAPSTSTGIRTSVKICQSPNGKVFIQPANLSKLTGSHFTQRLLPSSILGSSGNAANKLVPPRIAIQKVQIIPAGTSFSNATNAAQQQQQQSQARLATPTHTLGKGGSIVGSNIFMHAKNVANATPTTTTTTAVGNKVTISSGGNSNVVVIDASSGKPLTQNTKLKTIASHLHNRAANIESSQMITEDTPVDIIVDDDENGADAAPTRTNQTSSTSTSAASSASSSSITAVLASNLVTEPRQVQKPTTISLPMTVLDDWEMEIDQQNKQQSQQQQQQQQQVHQLENAETIIIDDSFEDVIIEEEEEPEEGDEGEVDEMDNQEQEDTTATESEHYDSEDQQQQQQQQLDYQTINDNGSLQQNSLKKLTDVGTTNTTVDQQQSEGETNYESVPMCIEESIETTHIDGGGGDGDGGGGNRDGRLSETESADASFTSSYGNENASFNTSGEIVPSDDASQKSNVTMENTDDQTEEDEEESSQEFNDIEDGHKKITIKSTLPEMASSISSSTDNELKMATADVTETTKISASLLTVKDCDGDIDDLADMDENTTKTTTTPTTNYDLTDEAKSNQHNETTTNTISTSLNAPTTE